MVVGVEVAVVVVWEVVAVDVMDVVVVGVEVCVLVVVGDDVPVEVADEVMDVVGVVRSHASKSPLAKPTAAPLSTVAVALHEASLSPSAKYPPSKQSMLEAVSPRDHSGTSLARVCRIMSSAHCASSTSKFCPL